MSAYILDEKHIRKTIGSVAASGHDFLLPLFLAVMEGKMNLMVLAPGRPWPKQELRMADEPCMVLVSDDSDLTGTGPKGWPRELRNWSQHAMVHAAGGTVQSYRQAVSRCIEHSRYILVESNSRRMAEWTEFFMQAAKPVSVDLIIPEGGVHPLPVDRSKTQ